VQVVGCLTLYLIFLHGIKMKIRYRQGKVEYHFKPLTWKALMALNLTQHWHLPHQKKDMGRPRPSKLERPQQMRFAQPTAGPIAYKQLVAQVTAPRCLSGLCRQSLRFALKSLTESLRDSANLPLPKDSLLGFYCKYQPLWGMRLFWEYYTTL